MYLILNQDLKTKDRVFEDMYQVSISSNKDVFVEMFDMEEFNNRLLKNYSLGEDIHVYLIDENSIKKKEDVLSENLIYTFKVLREVSFKILKSTSLYLEENVFMMYKFCSSIDSLIASGKWDKCVEGLINSLDFFKLVKIFDFLKSKTKTSSNIDIINKTIESVRENLILKSFDEVNIDFKCYLMLISLDSKYFNLLISRIKLSIYKDVCSLEDIEDIIKSIQIYNKNFLFKFLSLEILERVLVLKSQMNYPKKIFNEFYDSIYNIIKSELMDGESEKLGIDFKEYYKDIESLNESIIKSNKKLHL